MNTKHTLFLVIVCGGILVACQEKKPVVEDNKAFMLSDTMMKRIELASVVTEPVRSELTLVGKVIADENRVIKVFPLVGGNVENVTVELGDYVRKGQVLATIRSGEVADFERQMIQAQAEVLVAEKNLKTAEELFESKLNSQREVTSAKKEVENAQAELNRMKEVFRIYGLGKTQNYIVKAPIDGFVLSKNVNPGMQLRSDNNEQIFTIGQISEVWVMANVNESDIPKVKLGMMADIQTISYGDELFRGSVDKIYNVLDPENKTMKVRIRLNNAGYKLKPEMHATVSLKFDEGGSMTAIPAGAVIFDRSKNWVMVFKSRSNIETREVNVYKMLNDVAYIQQGLKNNERVISKNQLLVYDALND